MGPLTSQNCPLTSQFFVQYLRDFLTVCIDPVKYKFLCMPESCSDPSVCTQETAALLKIYRASHLRCAPGYHCNDINCLITGNPNNDVAYYCHFYSPRCKDVCRACAPGRFKCLTPLSRPLVPATLVRGLTLQLKESAEQTARHSKHWHRNCAPFGLEVACVSGK